MKIVIISILAVAMVGLMVPSAFAAGAIEGEAEPEPKPKKVIESSEFQNLKKFIPDYYNYIPEQSRDDGKNFLLYTTIDKGDGITGAAIFWKFEPSDITWKEFQSAKNSPNLGQDHFPDLPADSCFERLHDGFKIFVCMKDDVMISVYASDGQHRSTMKQILNKMDGELSIPNISGGGCLIATAAFGSEMEPQVQFLREIRDNTVLQTQAGTSFMTGFNQFYYSFSPVIADYERENPVFKEAVKLTLTPLLTSLTLLNYVDIDTEQEMLGYGIGVILLNIGMYFVAPAIVIISLKKQFKF